MLELSDFKIWLKENTNYSNPVISDIISRLKRANKILNWYNDEIYIFRLEQSTEFKLLSTSVKSQLKKAVKLYFRYINENREMEEKQ